ncbi:MAG: GNAT family N-acetyltransferase [Bacteroidetes bacterium MedPE-SWsnd-G2]|nr:MAG: GNAT family N-acetyltransferase [Bacteroidetes bacterium MedPE-SWsnd-G2]
MSKDNIVVREIRPDDNTQIEKVIKQTFIEYNLPKVGTAYEDAETPVMYESYQALKEQYFVIEENGIVQGGAGIKKLKGCEGSVCELQKMYFSPELRGRGLGKGMILHCLEFARNEGYEQCYLETAHGLNEALGLYRRIGFQELDEPMGNTGHYSCGIWMLKSL